LLPLEVASIAAVVLFALWRRGPRGTAAAGLDVPERIHEALVTARLSDRAAGGIATRAAAFYFPPASWRREPVWPGRPPAVLVPPAHRLRGHPLRRRRHGGGRDGGGRSPRPREPRQGGECPARGRRARGGLALRVRARRAAATDSPHPRHAVDSERAGRSRR